MSDEFYGYLDIKNSLSRIEESINSIDSFEIKDTKDILIQSFLADYLIILILRTVEGSIKNIVRTQLRIRNPKINLEKIERRFRRFNNPTTEEIANLFFDFLQIELDYGIFKEDDLRALTSINGYRQSLAHSKSSLDYETYDKSYPKLKKQYEDVKSFILKLCELYH